MSDVRTGKDIAHAIAIQLGISADDAETLERELVAYLNTQISADEPLVIKELGTFTKNESGITFTPATYLSYLVNPFRNILPRELSDEEANGFKRGQGSSTSVTVDTPAPKQEPAVAEETPKKEQPAPKEEPKEHVEETTPQPPPIEERPAPVAEEPASSQQPPTVEQEEAPAAKDVEPEPVTPKTEEAVEPVEKELPTEEEAATPIAKEAQPVSESAEALSIEPEPVSEKREQDAKEQGKKKKRSIFDITPIEEKKKELKQKTVDYIAPEYTEDDEEAVIDEKDVTGMFLSGKQEKTTGDTLIPFMLIAGALLIFLTTFFFSGLKPVGTPLFISRAANTNKAVAPVAPIPSSTNAIGTTPSSTNAVETNTTNTNAGVSDEASEEDADADETEEDASSQKTSPTNTLRADVGKKKSRTPIL